MNYWPGTKIPKSNGNAFTSWKKGEPSILTKKTSVAKQLQTSGLAIGKSALEAKKSFTIYSKA